MKHHGVDMNVYDTDVKHHPIVVKRNAVEVDVNIIDIVLHIGGVKFPLVDMKWHLELVPLPHCESKNAAALITSRRWWWYDNLSRCRRDFEDENEYEYAPLLATRKALEGAHGILSSPTVRKAV